MHYSCFLPREGWLQSSPGIPAAVHTVAQHCIVAGLLLQRWNGRNVARYCLLDGASIKELPQGFGAPQEHDAWLHVHIIGVVGATP